MEKIAVDRQSILALIRKCAETLGHSPSRSEFLAETGVSQHQILRRFTSWNDAVRESGLEPDTTHMRVNDDDLLNDWGRIVRQEKQVVSTVRYHHAGAKYSYETLQKRFGKWSAIPTRFREYAKSNPGWEDVLALLPAPKNQDKVISDLPESVSISQTKLPTKMSAALIQGRPTYGDPIDFRGLRHEPVNEQGVVFLFGMIARELGYLVEALQAGYPDCEAKRQIANGKWQRIRKPQFSRPRSSNRWLRRHRLLAAQLG